MAYAVQLLIGSKSRVVIGDNAQEVSLSLTYQLEHGDTNIMQVVQEKSQEVARAHRRAWKALHDEAVKHGKPGTSAGKSRNGDTGQEDEPMPSQEEPMPSQEEPSSSSSAPPLPPVTAGQLAALQALLKQAGWSDTQRDAYLCEQFDRERLDDLSAAQAAQWLLELQRAARTYAEQQRSTRSTAAQNGASHKTAKP